VIRVLGLLAVGFTAFLGMRSLWVHFLLLSGFTPTIVIIVTLIVQLDYPFRGQISVSDEPVQRALSWLGAPARSIRRHHLVNTASGGARLSSCASRRRFSSPERRDRETDTLPVFPVLSDRDQVPRPPRKEHRPLAGHRTV
jgi:hypothetical protein